MLNCVTMYISFLFATHFSTQIVSEWTRRWWKKYNNSNTKYLLNSRKKKLQLTMKLVCKISESFFFFWSISLRCDESFEKEWEKERERKNLANFQDILLSLVLSSRHPFKSDFTCKFKCCGINFPTICCQHYSHSLCPQFGPDEFLQWSVFFNVEEYKV